MMVTYTVTITKTHKSTLERLIIRSLREKQGVQKKAVFRAFLHYLYNIFSREKSAKKRKMANEGAVTAILAVKKMRCNESDLYNICKKRLCN